MSKKSCTFAPVITRGLVAQLNSASDYGSEGYRFESCRGHKTDIWSFNSLMSVFLFPNSFYQKDSIHKTFDCRGFKILSVKG